MVERELGILVGQEVGLKWPEQGEMLVLADHRREAQAHKLGMAIRKRHTAWFPRSKAS